jgi:superfamily II DNA or RNA helicase
MLITKYIILLVTGCYILKEELLLIKSSYDELDHLLNDFWLPCLKHCHKYDRSVGYFSSSILGEWVKILPALKNKLFNSDSEDSIKIRLVTSPILSEADIEILRELSDLQSRQTWCSDNASRIIESVLDDDHKEIRDGTSLFAYLIATERLQIRFNFPQPGNECADHHLKEGVFYFDDGTIAFGGSANESIRGWSKNLEVVDVYRSWIETDIERIENKQHRFERIWNIETDNWKSVELSPEIIEKLRVRAIKEFPDEMKVYEEMQEEQEVPSGITPWPHQRKAIDIFLEKERGILEMATGTGKTKTTLWIIEELWNSGKIDSVIIAAHGNPLLDQWYGDLITFVNQLRIREDGKVIIYRHYGDSKEGQSFAMSHVNSLLLCNRGSSALPLRTLADNHGEKMLLIHDEVHGLGSPSNIENLKDLSAKVRYRIGLSATPEREYDDWGDQNEFIQGHIGPIIYTYELEDAIRDGILCSFDYVPLAYESSEEDSEKIQKVYAKAAARKHEGRPMSEKELFIDLARVYKESRAKLPIFEEYLHVHPKLLQRSILFTETKEYGIEVGSIIHDYIDDYKTFFSGEDQSTLEKFAYGKLTSLITCHRLSEGIDIRDLSTVVLFSSARAKLETIQRIGRSLRIDPNKPFKRALILDFIRQPDEGEVVKLTADQHREEWLSALSAVRGLNFNARDK